jgi:hypothetical protein
MTEPWTGEGPDPWLPDRIAYAEQAAAAEMAVREAVWAELSGWLVGVSRAVLRSPRPDPMAVFSQQPAWTSAVHKIVSGVITDTIGTAYRTMLGEDYRYDSRPMVVDHLAQVTNRMVRTPEQVFDLVVSEVSRGAELGESIPEIANRVDDVLDATHTERWPNRATVVARTETLGALNAGRTDCFTVVAEDTGDEFEQVWISTIDRRTRPSHKTADGQRVPVGQPFTVGGTSLRYPGDPLGPGKETIQCLPAGAIVDYAAIRSVIRRWYEGEMVKISFAGGDDLTITPNHPVLRSDGIWTQAGLLTEDDHCVRCDLHRGPLAQPDEDRRPAEISELYRTASKRQATKRIRLTPPDLHGDSPDGHVDVVPVGGSLRFRGQPASDQQIEQFGFSLTSLTGPGLCGTDRRSFPSRVTAGEVDDSSSTARVRCGDKNSPVLLAGPAHTDSVGLASRPGSETQLQQATFDGRPADVERLGHGKDALATFVPGRDLVEVDVRSSRKHESVTRGSDLCSGITEMSDNGCRADSKRSSEICGALPVLVAVAKIVKIERYAFAGHVFNLDTGVGWYTCNGIATRNCRCSTLLVEPGETLDLSNRQFGQHQ